MNDQKENEKVKKLTKLVLGVGLLFAIVPVLSVYNVWKSHLADSVWEQTGGIISKYSEKGWWIESKQTRYYFEYQYEINDKTYTNMRYNLGEEVVVGRGFKEGAPVNVYYNPEKPGESVLDTSYSRDDFIIFITFSGFLVSVAAMIYKESLWERMGKDVLKVLPETYNGENMLTSGYRNLLNDTGNMITINTGMSRFWNFGAPFFGASFITMGYLLFVNDNVIAPDWSLNNYLQVVLLFVVIGMILSALIGRFRYRLEIDGKEHEVRDYYYGLLGKEINRYSFSEIDEVILRRDTWRQSSTLCPWIMYLHTKGRKSIFVVFRHRDIQPQWYPYLNTLKKRIEYIMFGKE